MHRLTVILKFTVSLVPDVNTIRREIIFATFGTAKRFTNLVLGAEMVDQQLLLFEYLAAHLTDELQAQAHIVNDIT